MITFWKCQFQIDTDWKLGFIGRNGRGKTTFLNLLLGKYEYHGKYKPLCNLITFHTLLAIKQINCGHSLGSLPAGGRMGAVERTILSGSPWWCALETIFTLSNGEQTKVLLAALFLNDGHFYWLMNRQTIGYESQRNRFSIPETEKGFILVSHDRCFRWLCWPYPVDQSVKHRSTKRKFSTWFTNFQRQQEFELAQNVKLKKALIICKRPLKELLSGQTELKRQNMGTARLTEGISVTNLPNDETLKIYRSAAATGNRGKVRPS